ncbi:hypothetical protein [Amycolatopsis sp. NPDC051071]
MSLDEVLAFHRQEAGPVRFAGSFGAWVAHPVFQSRDSRAQTPHA